MKRAFPREKGSRKLEEGMSKQQYKEFCRLHPVPIFLRPEWIESVAEPDQWGVCVIGEGRDLKGFFLYFIKRKYGFRRMILPPLTPYLGPWIIYPEGQKRAQRYQHEKQVMEALIAQLPPYDELILQFHPAIRNWLPFYWKGYKGTLRYTYRIEDCSDTQKVFEGMKGNIRSALRKAEKRFEVVESNSIDELHELKIKDFSAKRIPLDYDREYFGRVDRTLTAHNARKLLYAIDPDGKVHGGIYLAMDHQDCYFLIGAVDPNSKSDGTMPLLMWEGIREASRRGLAYDFEGSMIETIERFFRSFGGEQTPYIQIEQTPSFLLRARKALRSL